MRSLTAQSRSWRTTVHLKCFEQREAVKHAAPQAAAVFSFVCTAFTILLSGRKGLAAALVLGFCATASADDILFENVRIFDGKGDALSAPSNVLVKGNVIER